MDRICTGQNNGEERPDAARAFLSAFFSDETELFRSPAEPDPGQGVAIRLRGPKLTARWPFQCA